MNDKKMLSIRELLMQKKSIWQRGGEHNDVIEFVDRLSFKDKNRRCEKEISKHFGMKLQY